MYYLRVYLILLYFTGKRNCGARCVQQLQFPAEGARLKLPKETGPRTPAAVAHVLECQQRHGRDSAVTASTDTAKSLVYWDYVTKLKVKQNV